MAKVSGKTREFQVKCITEVPAKPGVYAYFHKGVCLYVGESSNIQERLKTHLGSRRGVVPNRVIYYWLNDKKFITKDGRLAWEMRRTKQYDPLWLSDREEFYYRKPLTQSKLVDIRKEYEGEVYRENYLVLPPPNFAVLDRYHHLLPIPNSLAPKFRINGEQIHMDDIAEEALGIENLSMALPEIYLDHLCQFIERKIGIVSKEFIQEWYLHDYNCEFCGQITKNLINVGEELHKKCEVCVLKEKIQYCEEYICELRDDIANHVPPKPIDMQNFLDQFRE